MTRKILCIAGEPSGDHRGADVIAALKKRIPSVHLYGVGGEEMEAAGMQLIHNITELSVIGLVEVAKSYPRLKRVFNDLRRVVDEDTPDAVLFIDYPGFNLRLAKALKKKHPELPVLYFVSPQIWAWGHRRIHMIRRYVDLMMVLFPFEVDVYEKGGKWVVENDTLRIQEHDFRHRSSMKVSYVGHPLTKKIEEFEPEMHFLLQHNIPENRRIIGLLPGSRNNEITRILPVMLRSAEQIRRHEPEAFFIISCARPGLKPLIEKEIVNARISDFTAHYRVCDGATYSIAHYAELVLAASGTAAFETALLHTPVLVLYHINYITFFVARALFTIPFINLTNIIARRRVVPEFIQYQMTPSRIVYCALKLLRDKEYYNETIRIFKEIHEVLGHGDAGDNAAREICTFMKWNNE
jgi:lipid-A-disaccharide synthase